MVCRYQCYNPPLNISGFNDVLFLICKDFKLVMQFVTLFQKKKLRKKKQNKNKKKRNTEPVESNFRIIDAYNMI